MNETAPLRGGRNFGSRRLKKFRVGDTLAERVPHPNLFALRAQTFDRPSRGRFCFVSFVHYRFKSEPSTPRMSARPMLEPTAEVTERAALFAIASPIVWR